MIRAIVASSHLLFRKPPDDAKSNKLEASRNSFAAADEITVTESTESSWSDSFALNESSDEDIQQRCNNNRPTKRRLFRSNFGSSQDDEEEKIKAFRTNHEVSKNTRQGMNEHRDGNYIDGYDDVALQNGIDDDIPLKDKILVSVSRMLMDKKSRPSQLFRNLIAAFSGQCQVTPISANLPRARRDSVRKIIQHVTHALLVQENSTASFNEKNQQRRSRSWAIVALQQELTFLAV